MTKEENISTLNEHLEHWKRLLSEKICDQSEGEKTIDALQNAIKALEQEPTDAVDRVTIKEYLYSLGMGIKVTATDCVKRQDVEDAIYDYSRSCDVNYAQIMEFIDKLPSVTPQPKMGRWLIKRVGDHDHAICSVCGDDSFLSPEWDALELYKYCPNCGSDNREVEK